MIYNLITPETLSKIKDLEMINREKENDIKKLFEKEVLELKIERRYEGKIFNKGSKKELVLQYERITKEFADCIIFYLQMSRQERMEQQFYSMNLELLIEMDVKLSKKDDYLEVCIMEKVERTINRFSAGFYD